MSSLFEMMIEMNDPLVWVRLRDDGARARWAAMRPARAVDELRSLWDFRVWLRPDSFPGVLLSRVVVGFASSTDERVPCGADLDASRVDVGRIEQLDVRDRDALERAYRQLNRYEEMVT